MAAPSIVVGVMGDFTSWRQASYEVELPRGSEGSRPGEPKLVESRMSTIALFSSLKESGEEPSLIVVAPETLAALNRWRRAGSSYEPIEEARGLPDPVESLQGAEGYCPQVYTSFLGGLAGFLARWIRGEASERGVEVEPSVSVAPAVGDYTYTPVEGPSSRRRARWLLRGPQGLSPFSLFASTALLAVLRGLLRAGERAGEEGLVRLYVDLTHGVNYTSTALYRAALAAARIYSLASGSRVLLAVYNSDPYPRGGGAVEKPVLKLWLIREETVSPSAAASRAFYMTLLPHLRGTSRGVLAFKLGSAPEYCKRYNGDNKNNECVKLYRIFNGELRGYERGIGGRVNYRDYTVMASVAVFYGLPLLLLQAGGAFLEASGVGEKSSILEGLVGVLERAPHLLCLKPDADSVEVARLGGLDFDHTRALLALAAYADYAQSVYAALKTSGEAFWESWDAQARAPGRAVASIRALKELVERLPGPNYYIAKTEVSNLEEASKCNNIGRSELYERICRAARSGKNQPAPEGLRGFDERTFTAHAGLSSGVVDVLAQWGGRGPALAYKKEVLLEGHDQRGLTERAQSLASRLAERLRGEPGGG